jgi:glycosyltransferase involved in cell wall biosynthesis
MTASSADPRRLRVGFVLHLAERDGAGLSVVELMADLIDAGVEVEATVPRRGPLCRDLDRLGVTTAVVGYRWWMDRGSSPATRLLRPWWNILLAVPLARRLRRSCDVVYSNSLAVAAGALAARLAGLPHVWHIHELWGRDTGLEFDLGARLSLRLVSALSDAVIASSRTIAAALAARLPRLPVRVIYPAITLAEADEARPIPGPGASPVCLQLAALHPVKRQEDVLRACACLAGRGIRIDVRLVGRATGTEEARLAALARDLDIDDRVRFLGEVEHPAALLGAANVLVSACPVEGLGRATIEAMLAGTAVVAARGAGNSELVRDGDTGLLYQAGDAAELAQAVERMLTDGAGRDRMVECAGRWARGQFSAAGRREAILEVLTGVRRTGRGRSAVSRSGAAPTRKSRWAHTDSGQRSRP